jgi:hypothetical protein
MDQDWYYVSLLKAGLAAFAEKERVELEKVKNQK